MLEVIKETFITRVWSRSQNQYESWRYRQLPWPGSGSQARGLTHVGLRCGWCDNNRNKPHHKRDVLESSWNHPCSPTSMEEVSFTKAVPGTKKVGVFWDWKCEPHCWRWFKSLGWPLSQGGQGTGLRASLKTLMLGGIVGRRRRGNRGWDSWMAPPTRWTWVWASSGSRWWTGRPGVLQFVGSQRVGHDWATEQQWQACVGWGRKRKGWIYMVMGVN